jgi:hypothetical protein
MTHYNPIRAMAVAVIIAFLLTLIMSCSPNKIISNPYIYQAVCGTVITTKVIIDKPGKRNGTTMLQTESEVMMLQGEHTRIPKGAFVYCKHKFPNWSTKYQIIVIIDGKEYNVIN